VLRAVRIRLGRTQDEVAAAAGVSRSTVSMLERGHLRNASVGMIRDVASALEISIAVTPRWRGAELPRLLDSAHAALVGGVVAAAIERGWSARPEVTFSRWGERGSIDVFAWREEVRALAVIECKSVIEDMQDLLSTMDRKRRLARDIAGDELGWSPRAVASILVLRESNLSRRRVEQHALALDATLPARTVEVRRWMRDPNGSLSGIWFLRCCDERSVGRRRGGPVRVNRPKSGP
jgi:transcriptional regulator with XRE-family HTH domain